MKILIRNMICTRCLLVVEDLLGKLHIPYQKVCMGEASLSDPVDPLALAALRIALLKTGLEIVDDRRSQLIDRIKQLVFEHIRCSGELPRVNFSTVITSALHYDYTYISNLFAASQGMTLEHYLIHHKIERVKELLICDDMTIAEISVNLGYSSAAHLSRQFRQVAGCTASSYRDSSKRRRPVQTQNL